MHASKPVSYTHLVKDRRKKCYDALNDDLNSPIVISHLFDASRAINSVKDGKATISAEDVYKRQSNRYPKRYHRPEK